MKADILLFSSTSHLTSFHQETLINFQSVAVSALLINGNSWCQAKRDQTGLRGLSRYSKLPFPRTSFLFSIYSNITRPRDSFFDILDAWSQSKKFCLSFAIWLPVLLVQAPDDKGSGILGFWDRKKLGSLLFLFEGWGDASPSSLV